MHYLLLMKVKLKYPFDLTKKYLKRIKGNENSR